MYIENFKNIVNDRYDYNYEENYVYDIYESKKLPITNDGCVKLLNIKGKYSSPKIEIIRNFMDANKYIENAIKDGYKLINYPNNTNYYINEKGIIFHYNRRNFKIKEHLYKEVVQIHVDIRINKCATIEIRTSNLINRTFVYPKLKENGFIELKDFKNIKNDLYLINDKGDIYSIADHCYKTHTKRVSFINLINNDGIYSTIRIKDLLAYYFINKGVK